jgi:hypothetical protein
VYKLKINNNQNEMFKVTTNLLIFMKVTVSWDIARSSLEMDVFKETCKKLNAELATQSECYSTACNATHSYRTIGGCCNNIDNKNLGSFKIAFDRFMANDYADKVSLP